MREYYRKIIERERRAAIESGKEAEGSATSPRPEVVVTSPRVIERREVVPLIPEDVIHRFEISINNILEEIRDLRDVIEELSWYIPKRGNKYCESGDVTVKSNSTEIVKINPGKEIRVHKYFVTFYPDTVYKYVGESEVPFNSYEFATPDVTTSVKLVISNKSGDDRKYYYVVEGSYI
ncbi:MAG TPA: hypothetical protein ENG74_02665 [Thermoplasmatales archaeon]|nr:hypothetical protein [Thermoplasmatales archaeon]